MNKKSKETLYEICKANLKFLDIHIDVMMKSESFTKEQIKELEDKLFPN